MALSEVGICNIAIIKVGGTTISSLSENVKAAKLCNVLYPQARDVTLQELWWTFATARQTLSRLSSDPSFGYDRQYQLPVDLLQPRYLSSDDGSARLDEEWEIEEDKLLTDYTGTVYLVYTKQVTDTSKFSSLFVEAVAAKLASEIAVPLANSNTLQTNMDALYRSKIAQARKNDRQRGNKKVNHDTRWIQSRKGGSGRTGLTRILSTDA